MSASSCRQARLPALGLLCSDGFADIVDNYVPAHAARR